MQFKTTKTVYILDSQSPPKFEKFDVVLVYPKLSDWPGKKLRGRVIFLTQSLDLIDTLWTKFRILDLIVILQTKLQCEVYSWFPYKPENCRDKPVLELIDTWQGDRFLKNYNFSQNRLPGYFANCPLKCTVAICPPFVGRNTQGPEAEILNDLLHTVKFKPQRARITDYQAYFLEPTQEGEIPPKSVYHFLTAGDTEIATTCLVKNLENLEFDSLPSHLTDYIVWHLPGSIPLSLRFGFAQALSPEIWAAIGGSFLSSLLFLFIVVRSKSFGFIFSWTTARLLSLPYPDLSKKTSLKLFSAILELSFIVISATYRSLLLLNLFINPVLKIETAKEGLKYGLTTMLRPLDASYFNQSDHDFWNHILQPGRHEMKLMFDYQNLIVNKSAMLLGRRIVDRALIFEKFPNIIYENEVFIQKEVYRIVSLVFLLRPNHPLTPLFTIKMLNIIECGFPEFYIQRAFNQLPHSPPEGQDGEDKALKFKQLQTFFYLFLILLIISSMVFVFEIVVNLICGPKKLELKFDRRHNHRLRILGYNREH